MYFCILTEKCKNIIVNDQPENPVGFRCLGFKISDRNSDTNIQESRWPWKNKNKYK